MRTERNLHPTAETETVVTGTNGITDTRGTTGRLTDRNVDHPYLSIMVETTAIHAQHTRPDIVTYEPLGHRNPQNPTRKRKKASECKNPAQ
jgi:hypothetical protein